MGPTREAERTPSANAQAIEKNKHGGWLQGVEFRPKGEDGLPEKMSAETDEDASPNRRPDAGHSSYWDQVPRFRDMWADHESRWPAERRPAADHPADPPGSYRSDGGFYLNPERHTETTAAIVWMRETEPGISADVRATERQNEYGGWLEGFERRLKGEDRLKEKVAAQATVEPDKPPSEILRRVPDAIRYTSCFQPENYTSGYYDIKERLESCGYEMYESRNSWNGAEYKGINTRWITPGGHRFEVQFHTPESYHAKEYVTHRAYEQIRNPLIIDEKRAELEAFQREVSSWIQVPEGAADIPDFKKEGF